MEFFLLGSVRARSNGCVAWPTSGRARCLLTALAWWPNEFVSDDILIDRIWGSSLPDDPRDSLYTSAKRLRRTIRRVSPSDWVKRRRGGYLLAADPLSIDLHQFRHDVSQAHDAVRRGHDGLAATLFERAVERCSDVPLSDVEGVWAGGVRETLSRERLSALVAGLEAGLRLGRHAELVPTLADLAERSPLDESIAANLILALYRSGRQAEALATYARTRRDLIEQVGTEPSTALEDLHRRLLRHDPSLGVRAHAAQRGLLP